MALHIGLADHPQADLVAGVEHHGVGRVVGGADRVETTPLDVLDIGPEVSIARRLATEMVMVMSVHAGDEERLTVQQQLWSDDLHPSESGVDGDDLAHATPRVNQTDHDAVAVGGLVRPERRAIDPHAGARDRPGMPVAVRLGGDVRGDIQR